jgi:hypothetical protein
MPKNKKGMIRTIDSNPKIIASPGLIKGMMLMTALMTAKTIMPFI